MASLIRTQIEANAALREHGLAAAGWTFAFDAAKKRGGACHYNRKQITLSRYLVPMWSDAEVQDTILHEVAHAMAGHAAGHGPQWRRIARMIGCTGTRTHSNETVQAPWEQRCPEHGVIGYVHRRKNNLICLACDKRGIKSRIYYTARVDIRTGVR